MHTISALSEIEEVLLLFVFERKDVEASISRIEIDDTMKRKWSCG
ncbi:hypothetical protein [Bacillus cereus]|nr:hypothetical protein [Bacillus cereus]